ncbi:hypothetical protein [Neisseria polysaccharea]|uniref:hypothetical protein n=1 Tax=Neisseria polysaccharea TaxID=489 RepID=UPI00131D208E
MPSETPRLPTYRHSRATSRRVRCRVGCRVGFSPPYSPPCNPPTPILRIRHTALFRCGRIRRDAAGGHHILGIAH